MKDTNEKVEEEEIDGNRTMKKQIKGWSSWCTEEEKCIIMYIAADNWKKKK